MSHSKIRTEKVCLNCGTETPGRYCPACGQENIEPKQSFWHLFTHFFQDITHFDGKFFLTVKDLFVKPGFLSREYMIGRRASYLDPIRMYIFTSAIFFLILFSFIDVKNIHVDENGHTEIRKDPEIGEVIGKTTQKIDSIKKTSESENGSKSSNKLNRDPVKAERGITTKLEKTDYRTIAAYDSAQKTLPAAKRDGWVKRKINQRKIVLNQRYEKEHSSLFREMMGNFLHNFPKMLFISLPAFAFILKLLYFRRKDYYYVDHGIFSIHLYIFSFLVMLVYLGIDQLNIYTGWKWLLWVMAAILIYPLIYYYKAMRRFYGQSRGKTILKYLLLFIMSFFLQLMLFISFVLFTVFEA